MKFVPIIRQGDFNTALPACLNGKLAIDLRGKPFNENYYKNLTAINERRKAWSLINNFSKGKTMKKTLTILMALVIVLGSIGQLAFAAKESEKIEYLKNKGYIIGDNEGNLNLDKTITRAEFSKMIVAIDGKEEEAKKLKHEKTPFTDLEVSHWSNGYINQAIKDGYIKGYTDNTFKPEANISYAEILTILAKDAGYIEIKNKTGKWADQFIEFSIENKFLADLNLEDFYQAGLRDQVFEILYNFLKTKDQAKKEPNREVVKIEDDNRSTDEKRKDKIQDLIKKIKHTNDYTGLGKGKNLIVIQVKGLQNAFLNKTYMNQEITPYLNSLTNRSDTIYFKDYMELTGEANSLDAEFVSLNSMYPILDAHAYEKYRNNELYGLISMARSKDYRASYMNGNTAEASQRDKIFRGIGFDEIYLGYSYKQDQLIGPGLADESFFKQSLENIKKLMVNDQAFFTFMLTQTNQAPYSLPQNKSEIKLSPEDENTSFGRTLNTHRYTDGAIKNFVEELKKAGIYENSVIVIYGDHYAMDIDKEAEKTAMTKFLGRDYDYDDMFNVPLLINIPGSNTGFVSKTIGSQIDLLPTLANIMGWNDETSLIFGRDLLEKYEDENIVYPQGKMPSGSFISGDELFIKSRTADLQESKLISRATREKISKDQAIKKISKAEFEIGFSKYLLENNLLGKIRQDYVDEEIKKSGLINKENTVMHAGGYYNNESYRNQKEAFNYNLARDKKYFEIDYINTADGQLVAMHSWDGFLKRFYGKDDFVIGKALDYNEFMSLKSVNDYSQFDAKLSIDWLRANPEAFFITDIKENNIENLKIFIKPWAEGIMDRIIPQVYTIEEYYEAKALGFGNIIYTSYMNKDTLDQIIEFAKTEKPFGITLTLDRFESGAFDPIKSIEGVKIFVHTINDLNQAEDLINRGAYGVYTDRL